MGVTIYHNPRCSKSRQTLALIEENGVKPEIIEYLAAPPTQKDLQDIVAKLKIAPRDLVRKKEAKEAGLDLAAMSDPQVIKAMANHPAIIERPIVVKGSKAVLGRPPENVLTLL